MIIDRAPLASRCPQALADWTLERGPLRARFARDAADRDRVFALRWQVFAQEMGCRTHGADGREWDAYDASAHHLLVEDGRTGEVVGTYRLLTAELAARGAGFYSASEFVLDDLPDAVLREGVELGRACVAHRRRGGAAFLLLLAGVARYLEQSGKRWFFGCASLPTLEPMIVAAVLQTLRGRDAIDPTIHVRARADYRGPRTDPDRQFAEVALPALVERYLAIGARVCSEPAYDREFRGTDLLVALDVGSVPPDVVRSYTQGRR